MSELANHVVMT